MSSKDVSINIFRLVQSIDAVAMISFVTDSVSIRPSLEADTLLQTAALDDSSNLNIKPDFALIQVRVKVEGAIGLSWVIALAF